MRLSSIRGRQQYSSSGSTALQDDANTTNTPGTIRNCSPYQRPISALLDGQPVTILATGDISGMSPAFQFVDENGHVDWASSDDFVVDDNQIVPRTAAQRQKLNSSRR